MNNQTACFPITSDGDKLVLNQITKVRLADGREVGVIDWSWRPIYSVIDTLSGWTEDELRAFSYSEGQPVMTTTNLAASRENATLRHTNLKSPGEMDSLEEFLVYAMCVEVYEMNNTNDVIVSDQVGQPSPQPNNVAHLHERCILELEISQKEYQQASLGWFAAGFGVSGFGSDDANDRLYSTNGAPSRDAVDMMPVPQHIGGTEKFAAVLKNPGGATITYRDQDGSSNAALVERFRINLMGLHKRPTG